MSHGVFVLNEKQEQCHQSLYSLCSKKILSIFKWKEKEKYIPTFQFRYVIYKIWKEHLIECTRQYINKLIVIFNFS